MFKSELRVNILLLLYQGEKSLHTLDEKLDTEKRIILSHLKIMEDHYLIKSDLHTYELTAIGLVLTNKILPLLDCLGELEYML
jgi:predicted transcriptional regulator